MAGVAMPDPKQPSCAKPVSSRRMTTTFGAPAGGRLAWRKMGSEVTAGNSRSFKSTRLKGQAYRVGPGKVNDRTRVPRPGGARLVAPAAWEDRGKYTAVQAGRPGAWAGWRRQR